MESLKSEDIYDEEDIPSLPSLSLTPDSEPLHAGAKLKWDHPLDLIGEKVCDPMIHCCEACKLPILVYGRMIACKHVLCAQCAQDLGVVGGGGAGAVCPRCKDPVTRVERVALGTVFMCTVGGKKHDFEGCRRTYLSQRDLQAHIAHRHIVQLQSRTPASGSGSASLASAVATHPPPAGPPPPAVNPQAVPPPSKATPIGIPPPPTAHPMAPHSTPQVSAASTRPVPVARPPPSISSNLITIQPTVTPAAATSSSPQPYDYRRPPPPAAATVAQAAASASPPAYDYRRQPSGAVMVQVPPPPLHGRPPPPRGPPPGMNPGGYRHPRPGGYYY